MTQGFGAIVLAGGGARRMGGAPKPAIAVGGEPMLVRVLRAVSAADPRIVVGPDPTAGGAAADEISADGRTGSDRGSGRIGSSEVTFVMEDPPGGGPVAAIGAAWPHMRPASLVVLVAGDLPLLRIRDIADLVAAVGAQDGAVFVDASGRPQWLCGAWRVDAIAKRLADVTAERGTLANTALRMLLGPLSVTEVGVDAGARPPYFDCDTEDDIRRAEEWLADGRTG